MHVLDAAMQTILIGGHSAYEAEQDLYTKTRFWVPPRGWKPQSVPENNLHFAKSIEWNKKNAGGKLDYFGTNHAPKWLP